MGDAAGELAHGLHLLRLAQGLLGGMEVLSSASFSLVDVPAHGLEEIVRGDGVPVDPARLAVAGQHAELANRRGPRPGQRADFVPPAPDPLR